MPDTHTKAVHNVADDLRGMDGLVLTGEQQRAIAEHMIALGYKKIPSWGKAEFVRFLRINPSLRLSMQEASALYEVNATVFEHHFSSASEVAGQAVYQALKRICLRWESVPADCVSEEHQQALAALALWEQAER